MSGLARRGVHPRPFLAGCACLVFLVAAARADDATSADKLELHFLNATVEEGSWSSDEETHADLKPLCGEIEIHAIYSGVADALRLIVNGREVDRQSGADVRLHWDTRSWPDGTHRVELEAVGEKDETVASYELTLDTTTEQDREPPVVTIVFPPADSIVRGITVVRVDARDDHEVARVRLLLDGELLDEKAQFPFAFSWDTRKTASGARHRLQAEASDKAGNVGSSEVIGVMVSNPVGLGRNPTLTGLPPGAWRVYGGATLEAATDGERGAFLSITTPPDAQGPVGIEQEITLDSPVPNAVITLTARPPEAIGEELPPACRLVLLGQDDDVVVAATAGGERATAGEWNETSVPVPPLSPGRFTLRLAIAAAGRVARCDVTKADMVVP